MPSVAVEQYFPPMCNLFNDIQTGPGKTCFGFIAAPGTIG